MPKTGFLVTSSFYQGFEIDSHIKGLDKFKALGWEFGSACSGAWYLLDCFFTL